MRDCIICILLYICVATLESITHEIDLPKFRPSLTTCAAWQHLDLYLMDAHEAGPPAGKLDFSPLDIVRTVICPHFPDRADPEKKKVFAYVAAKTHLHPDKALYLVKISTNRLAENSKGRPKIRSVAFSAKAPI